MIDERNSTLEQTISNYPDLPVVILVYNSWNLEGEYKDPPGYIGKNGETVFDIKKARQILVVGDIGSAIHSHQGFGKSSVYYQPRFHARNDKEQGILRTWNEGRES